MQKLAVKVLVVLMASITMVSYADLPILSQDENLSFVKYGKNLTDLQTEESHSFFSDGTYCYVGSDEFLVIGGKWHYKTNNLIDIQVNPLTPAYFAYWDTSLEDNPLPQIFFSDLVMDKKVRLLVGFGDLVPNKMAWYDTNQNDGMQTIPQDAKYVFVGDGSKNAVGGYNLMRFSLQPNPNKQEVKFTYYLTKNLNQISPENLKNFKPNYQIEKNELIAQVFGKKLTFNTNIVKKVSLQPNMDKNFQHDKKAHDFCQSGKKSLLFDPVKKEEEIIVPIIISWNGNIDPNPNWLK